LEGLIEGLQSYLNNFVDYVEKNFTGKEIWIAGRDGEILYDSLKLSLNLRQKDTSHIHLIPYNVVLMTKLLQEPSNQQKQFFSQYGLTEQTIATKDFILLDSGFYGHFGEHMEQILSRLYQGRIREDQFKTYVVSAGVLPEDAYAKELDIPVSVDQIQENKFKILDPVIKNMNMQFAIKKWDIQRAWHYRFAMALQILPKFHKKVDTLVYGEDMIQAVSSIRDICKNLIPTIENEDIVHPVAALIIQYRLIKLLSISPQSGEAPASRAMNADRQPSMIQKDFNNGILHYQRGGIQLIIDGHNIGAPSDGGGQNRMFFDQSNWIAYRLNRYGIFDLDFSVISILSDAHIHPNVLQYGYIRDKFNQEHNLTAVEYIEGINLKDLPDDFAEDAMKSFKEQFLKMMSLGISVDLWIDNFKYGHRRNEAFNRCWLVDGGGARKTQKTPREIIETYLKYIDNVKGLQYGRSWGNNKISILIEQFLKDSLNEIDKQNIQSRQRLLQTGKASASRAMNGNAQAPGGIDLTPKRMNLEVEKDKAMVAQGNVETQNFVSLQNIEINALYIKDIEIKPLDNLPQLLGLSASG